MSRRNAESSNEEKESTEEQVRCRAETGRECVLGVPEKQRSQRPSEALKAENCPK